MVLCCLINKKYHGKQPQWFYSSAPFDYRLLPFNQQFSQTMLRQKQTLSPNATKLRQMNIPSKALQAEQSGIMIWKTGTVMQAMQTEMPLQGISSVAIQSPNISMSPGPIIVISALSFRLKNKYISTIFHFQLQNRPKTLLIRSLMMKISRVLLKPLESPMHPQIGAAVIPPIVITIAQKARQWSSFRIGIKISFIYRLRQIKYRGTRYEIHRRIKNLRSERASLNRVAFICFYSITDRWFAVFASTFTMSSSFFAEFLSLFSASIYRRFGDY